MILISKIKEKYVFLMGSLALKTKNVFLIF